MKPEIAVLEQDDNELGEFLHSKIREFNKEHSIPHRKAREPGAVLPLFVILKDEEGQAIGGLSATTYWNWLEIEHFFVPEDLRGQDLGSRILQLAEAAAQKRGCTHSFLTTFSFQARFFYETQGYKVAGSLEGYPPGATYYWMRKDFK